MALFMTILRRTIIHPRWSHQLLRPLALLFTMLLLACSQDSGIDALFQEARVNGCLIIVSLDGSTRYEHNPERVGTAYLPASTFKIPNTLIALKQGVIQGADEIIPWNGQQYDIASWNHDQSIRTAFPNSCVWFYQELARRVGNASYLDYLQKLNYGNALTGPDVTRFWLDGDLRISAEEQIGLLKRLYRHELPFPAGYMDLVKEQMFIEAGPDYVLRAKTGWTVRVDQQIGWYVGWLETGDQVWFFALNMDMPDTSTAHWRKDLVMAALKQAGLIRDPASYLD